MAAAAAAPGAAASDLAVVPGFGKYRRGTTSAQRKLISILSRQHCDGRQ